MELSLAVPQARSMLSIANGEKDKTNISDQAPVLFKLFETCKEGPQQAWEKDGEPDWSGLKQYRILEKNLSTTHVVIKWLWRLCVDPG